MIHFKEDLTEKEKGLIENLEVWVRALHTAIGLLEEVTGETASPKILQLGCDINNIQVTSLINVLINKKLISTEDLLEPCIEQMQGLCTDYTKLVEKHTGKKVIYNTNPNHKGVN